MFAVFRFLTTEKMHNMSRIDKKPFIKTRKSYMNRDIQSRLIRSTNMTNMCPHYMSHGQNMGRPF